jgi:K+-sensing histidine kinase KdpD
MKDDKIKLRRSPNKVILKDHKRLVDSNYIVEISESSNTMFMILNINRQIIIANKKLINLINLPYSNVLGQRPGEIFNCINSKKLKSGCGTHLFCKECGASKAIAAAIKGISQENECRISSKIDGKNVSFDLSINCQPMIFDEKKHVLMSVIDISDKKRREILEKTFFHDIMNTVGGVYGYVKILQKRLRNNPEEQKIANIATNLTDRLIKEIKSQQVLLDAENNKLTLNLAKVDVIKLIQDATDLIKENSFIGKCNFKQSSSHKEIIIKTDEIILHKVLLNLIKNAAEASKENQTVTIKSLLKNNEIRILIHNQSYIPEDIQHQIFQRSFSTKGGNRGIGTYSIKLFTENYLDSEVWFESSVKKGTYFYLNLPTNMQS